jgi:hypothetical protein
MANFDPENLGATFEETGGGAEFPGAPGFTQQSVNPGFDRSPINPQLPEYIAPWMHGLPAGELHPQIDEMAGMVPNTLTAPNGGPGIEFPEIMFGADLHCANYDPAVFGAGPPNFGWGAVDPVSGEPVVGLCPNSQSGVANNFAFPVHGTWPVPNRVLRDGAFKAPPLRNVELTGPYFHTGSYLTLRQVVDFYMRGGDFPITNAESRDPHIVDIEQQAFAFGRTTGADLLALFDCSAEEPNIPGVTPVTCGNFPFLTGTFADGLPDTVFLYDAMPDTDHPVSPEFATPEDAKVALVKFLLSLTDPRVKYERAPFDHPEIFVPIDGKAPDNTFGRTSIPSRNGFVDRGKFIHVPAVGAGGSATPLPNFLGVSSLQRTDPGFPVGAISHFDSSSGFRDLTLLTPNGGEVITGGSSFTISWGGPDGVDHYKLEFSRDGGKTWEKIGGAIPGTDTSFVWTSINPKNDKLNCLIKVQAKKADNTVIEADKSNAPFTLLHTP